MAQLFTGCLAILFSSVAIVPKDVGQVSVYSPTTVGTKWAYERADREDESVDTQDRRAGCMADPFKPKDLKDISTENLIKEYAEQKAALHVAALPEAMKKTNRQPLKADEVDVEKSKKSQDVTAVENKAFEAAKSDPVKAKAYHDGLVKKYQADELALSDPKKQPFLNVVNALVADLRKPKDLTKIPTYDLMLEHAEMKGNMHVMIMNRARQKAGLDPLAPADAAVEKKKMFDEWIAKETNILHKVYNPKLTAEQAIANAKQDFKTGPMTYRGELIERRYRLTEATLNDSAKVDQMTSTPQYKLNPSPKPKDKNLSADQEKVAPRLQTAPLLDAFSLSLSERIANPVHSFHALVRAAGASS
jgi:hypothetical protein